MVLHRFEDASLFQNQFGIKHINMIEISENNDVKNIK